MLRVEINVSRKKKYKIAVMDSETDPFLFGRVPEPFCMEFYNGKEMQQFWGDDCADQLLDWLEEQEEQYLIYAHNGGKFDFHFLHKAIDNPALIIKSRIVEAKLGKHKVRDSYAILPIPLRDYAKEEFNYDKMEREVREKNKDEILAYLHSDCVYLFELVSAFINRFGPKMTIGGTAIKELEKLHPFRKNGSRHDKVCRPFYYGGRVQCFEGGELTGPWKLIDVNSMYPTVMKNFKHPINGGFDIRETMPDNFNDTFFMRFYGKNRGALPSRDKDNNLVFDLKEGWFNACSHEIKVALKYDLIDIEKIDVCYVAQEQISFGAYVDKFYKEKADCKENGDKRGELFAKLLLNSAYGRTGINPENFEDWIIHRDFGNDDELEINGYKKQVDYDDLELWAKPADILESHYCDVAIAASITSAARSVLLEGLQQSIKPVYCDTDSIICADFNGKMDKLKLGAWDLELEAEKCAIAGKKMYCLFDEKHIKLNGPCADQEKRFKLSSKGGTLKLNDIIALCRGQTIEYANPAPTFSLKKAPSFVLRNFRQTVDKGEFG